MQGGLGEGERWWSGGVDAEEKERGGAYERFECECLASGRRTSFVNLSRSAGQVDGKALGSGSGC
jgi:hypothetical protein